VPANVIAAIIGVETLYGEHLGNYRVLDAITSLSFDYPDPLRPDRIEMFQGQLADLIELHYQGKVDATRQLGSYAGAMGIPQFMPTSLKRWAVSANPDRAINLENHVDDAILSVANFLVEHGWIRGLPVFAPVRLPADPAKLVAGGLIPTLTWPELEAQGATIATGAPPNSQWMDYPLGVIDLPTSSQNRVEYRTATPNFFALTQYNRSYFYATAVEDLAQALIGAASATPSPALSHTPSARLR
jgi:membrane-bound lytic murein transglycosylase B